MNDDDETLITGLTLGEAKRLYPLRPRKAAHDPGARISSYLSIEGRSLNRDACSEAIGAEPTSFTEDRIVGHLAPSGRPNVRPAAWKLGMTQEPSDTIDGCLRDLLEIVWPRRTQLLAILDGRAWTAVISQATVSLAITAAWSLGVSPTHQHSRKLLFQPTVLYP